MSVGVGVELGDRPRRPVVLPAIWTVQDWPTVSSVRLAADAWRVTVRSGSVSDRMASPGVDRGPGLDEDLPTRVGHCPRSCRSVRR